MAAGALVPLGGGLVSGGALLAQVMQVDRVEHDLGLRGVLADQREVLHGDVVPRQDEGVEAFGVGGEPLRYVGHVGVVQRLDAHLLQRRRVALEPGAVLGQERHFGTQRL